MNKLALTVALLSLGFAVACERPLSEPFESPSLKKAVLEKIPADWALAETQKDQIPYGHYNTGHGGELLILVGPQPFYFHWNDEVTGWSQEPLAHEALRIWIMPASYRRSRRSLLDWHAPVPAERVFAGKLGRVYGSPWVFVSSRERYDELLRRGTGILFWTDVAGKGISDKPLSWATWKADLARYLRESPEL